MDSVLLVFCCVDVVRGLGESWVNVAECLVARVLFRPRDCLGVDGVGWLVDGTIV